MWPWPGRPSRNLPQVDYNEDSSSEEDNFVSPRRPANTRSGSPQPLAVPTLSDNVDEELEQVSQTLKNIGHTNLFKREIVDSEEEVIEGHVAGGPEGQKVKDNNMPDDANEDVDIDVENGEDGAKAIDHSRTLKIEYNPTEVEFWFVQLENEMYTCEVKSQWLKRCILVKNLPPKVQSDVMTLLLIKKSAAPDDLYKQIKDEILRIHAPRKEDTYKKALTRVLIGLPSQLGQVLITDICDKDIKLSGCCCAKAVFTLWCIQLPVTVRSQISNLPFNKDTYQDVFQKADNIYLSTKTTEVSASVAAVGLQPKKSEDPVSAGQPQVAATRARGQGRRNGRGNRNGNANSGSSTGGGNRNSGNGGQSQGSGRGPRHSSNPPSSCCDNHYRWGASSWFCLNPLTCPWVSKCQARPGDKKDNN